MWIYVHREFFFTIFGQCINVLNYKYIYPASVTCKNTIPAQDHRAKKKKNSRTYSGLEKKSGKMFIELYKQTVEKF